MATLEVVSPEQTKVVVVREAKYALYLSRTEADNLRALLGSMVGIDKIGLEDIYENLTDEFGMSKTVIFTNGAARIEGIQ